MEFLSFFLYAVSIKLFGLCNAFPLLSSENAVAIDRQIVNSQYFLGAIGLVTIISVIGACLCCRRRKRGFEEFKNEAIPGENHRSEFPIFRALSPDQENNRIVTCSNNSPVAIVPGNQHNVSRERLFDEDIDNNNTTLSQADLENIENNNAVDYIPNLNEPDVIAAAIANEPLNIAAANYNNNIIVESQQTTSSSSVNTIQQQIESQPSPPSPIALPIPINEIECQIVSVYSNYHQAAQLPPPPSLYMAQSAFSNHTTSDLVNTVVSNNNSCVELFKPQIDVDDADVENTPTTIASLVDGNVVQSGGGGIASINPFICDVQAKIENVILNSNSNIGNVPIEIEKSVVIDIDRNVAAPVHFNNNISNKPVQTNNFSVPNSLTKPRDECSTSMHSISSEKSNNSSDINSVEEALLALDNVLADEDTPGNDYDDDEYEDDITIGNDEHNVYQHLLKSNSANSNDITHCNLETNNSFNKNSNSNHNEEFVNLIKDEAIKLVDHVLSESKKFITIHNEAMLDNNCSFIVNNDDDDDGPDENNADNDGDNKDLISQNSSNTQVKTADTSEMEDDSMSALNQTVIDLTTRGGDDIVNKTTSFSVNLNESSNDSSLDNILSNMSMSDDGQNFNAISSTPLVQTKTVAVNNTADAWNTVEARDKLKSKFNSAFDNLINEDVNNATFPIQEIVADTAVDFDDSDVGCAPLINNETFDQLPPPEIKIDRDETNSEDMTTVTPVNTPIELNYSIETWDKFISNSMHAQKDSSVHKLDGTFDVNQPSTSGIHLKNNTSVNDNGGGGGGGWFLHPPNSPQQQQPNDETFDLEEEDEENLNMTYEALRKQLAEVLPHAQGIQGPPEYSDEEDSSTQNDRTFDEYRSPLNKCDELDEALVASLPPPPNEIIINYKRPLSPIMEESEDETCKTFVLNETKCLDSTSPGYMESGDEALGVSKPLMASNDTLFNLEDTFGDDLFSPRATSQTDLNKIPPILDSLDLDKTVSIDLNTVEIQNAIVVPDTSNSPNPGTSDNPSNLTLNFEATKKFRSFELLSEEGVVGNNGNGNGDLCSPDQAKTFSEDINLTEAQSSDLSMTVDQDATYTTVEEKTCVTVNGSGILQEEHCDDMMVDDNVFTDNTFLKENERISEISEPEWEVTYSEKEKNPDEHSLLGLDSLDLLLDVEQEEEEGRREKNDNDKTTKNLNTIESDEKLSEFSFNSQRDKDEGISSSKDESENNDDETSDDDCNNSTKKFCNTTSSTSSENNDDDDNNESVNQQPVVVFRANDEEGRGDDSGASEFSKLNKNLADFINKEVEYNSSQYYSYSKNYINASSCGNDNIDNGNANVPNDNDVVRLKSQSAGKIGMAYNKVPLMANNHYSGKVLIPNSEGYLIEYNETNGNDKYHNQIDLIRPHKYQPVFVNNGGIYDLDLENYDNGMIVNHHHHHHHNNHAYLSGEDDPWSGYQIENGGSGGGGGVDRYSSEPQIMDNENVATTTFNINEWESDEEDDSNSSEEFMYVKGNTNINSSPLTKKSQELKNKYNNYQNLSNNSSNNVNSNNDRDSEDKDMDDDDDDVWATHQDQIPVAGDKGPIKELEDESCDDSSSDIEGEFIPSSWDAEAQPSRSALKSPDKSSSEEEDRGTKKQRSVAFKKQRYHSVYEYPREVIPLSPAYSEPQMWDRNSSMNRFDNTSDYNLDDDDVLDGWKVSSSTRPFHGSQFSPQCNTWPTDSDFSWSQLLNCNDDQNIKYQDYSELQIEWPTDFNDFFEKTDSKDNNFDDEVQRPDSGVGESAELLSESVSLGDLKHTKSLLRLPLNVSSVIASGDNTIENSNTNKLEDETNASSDNFCGIPTPSFTGSMDSLSTSSNGSDRPITFTTFGKPPPPPPVVPTSAELVENTKNAAHQYLVEMKQPQVVQQTCTPATLGLLIDTISNELKDVLEIKENSTTNHDRTKRQSDSTDEDSGIENLTRLAK